MDLSRYDSRQAAEAGVDVPLVIDGEPVYGDDDEAVTFKVKGVTDKEVQALILKISRAGDTRTPDEAIKTDMQLARATVVGWSGNFEFNGEKPKFSQKKLDEIMAIPAIRRAVLAEVFKEANFMPKS